MADDQKYFLRGEEGFTRKSQLDSLTKTKKERAVPRLWLKPEERTTIIFLDSDPVFLFEHNVKIGRYFGNYFTCIKEFKPCSPCEKGLKPVYTAYLSCINTKQFARSDGSIVKNRKELYPAKGSTIKRLQELIKKHGDLRGKAFEIQRYTADDPNCGASFEYVKDIDLSKIEDSAPFDYNKILAEPTVQELEDAGLATVVVGSEKDVEKHLAEVNDLLV